MVRRAMVFAVVALLFVAGCAGDGSTTVTSPTATTSTATTTTTATTMVSADDATIEYWITDDVLHFQASGSGIDCWSVTVDILWEIVEKHAEESPNHIGVGHMTTDEYVGYTVTYERLVGSDGGSGYSPSIPYNRLAEIVPEAVNGTVTVDDRSTACTEPIRLQNRTIAQD